MMALENPAGWQKGCGRKVTQATWSIESDEEYPIVKYNLKLHPLNHLMLLDIIIMLSICHYGYIFRVRKPTAPGTMGQEKAKWSMSECQHCCLHTLLTWNTYSDGNPSFSTKIPLGSAFKWPQSPLFQGHWWWGRHAMVITAAHQCWFLHTFLIWVTRGVGTRGSHMRRGWGPLPLQPRKEKT